MPRTEKLELENAKIMGGKFKNFSGRQTDFNKEGVRYINVRIPGENAEELIEKGWTIKSLAPREEGDEPVYYLKVNIRFVADGGVSDPKIFKGTSPDNMHRVTAETVGDLDRDEFENVDLVIRPYHWQRSTGEGIAAYLEEMYALIKGSRFSAKYSIKDDDVEEDD